MPPVARDNIERLQQKRVALGRVRSLWSAAPTFGITTRPPQRHIEENQRVRRGRARPRRGGEDGTTPLWRTGGAGGRGCGGAVDDVDNFSNHSWITLRWNFRRRPIMKLGIRPCCASVRIVDVGIPR